MPFDSLYLHVPFCAGAKCDYCAFYSRPAPSAAERAAYLARLAGDLAALAPQCAPLRSVYLGGGTPTALPAAELDRLLALVHAHCHLAPDVEFTTEANPETLTAEKIAALAARGVNRVSLGVQSFNPAARAAIGRAGATPDVPAVVAALRAAGLVNLNLDLIYGWPGQDLAAWQEDLLRTLALEPAHVSTYALTLEPGTPLARRGLPEPDDDWLADLWELAGDRLGRAGRPRYEISNFARPGAECRHNVEIWHGHPFLAAGPAAHWFDGDCRWGHPADLDAWLRAAPPAADRLPPAARAAEILITGLRTVAGWERAAFRQVTGFDYLDLRGPALRDLAAAGLLTLTEPAVRPTARGLLLHDYLGRELL